jgi:hypothetical protein
MNNINTALKRILINALFGTGILLILLLAVVFRYYIDKQHPSAKQNQRAAQIFNTK